MGTDTTIEAHAVLEEFGTAGVISVGVCLVFVQLAQVGEVKALLSHSVHRDLVVVLKAEGGLVKALMPVSGFATVLIFITDFLEHAKTPSLVIQI